MATTHGSLWDPPPPPSSNRVRADRPFEEAEPTSDPPPVLDEMVTLRGGVTIPVAALKLALRLEMAGIKLHVDGDEVFATPSARVQSDDLSLLRVYRAALKAILEYRPPTNLTEVDDDIAFAMQPLKEEAK